MACGLTPASVQAASNAFHGSSAMRKVRLSFPWFGTSPSLPGGTTKWPETLAQVVPPEIL